MNKAGACADGRLADDLAATLGPNVQDALDHPTRRDILRVLHASESPSSVAGMVGKLAPLRRGEVRYHLQVLLDCDAVLRDETLPAVAGRDALYLSELGGDDKVLEVLRATERQDRKCRQARGGQSSSLLTMFRVPRPERTISLSNLLGLKTDREE